MDRSEKLALIALLEEKKKREAKLKPKFIPTEKQREIVMSEAAERYLFCGNGYGKSALLANEVHWAATGYNPYTKKETIVPAKIALVLDDPSKVEDFVIEYRKWNNLEIEQCHKKGKPHTSFITYPNGSTVTVLTHSVEPLKLEGSQWHYVFMDEPPPKRVYTGVVRGVRIKGHQGRVFLAGTPISAAWLRTDIYEKWTKGELEGVECFRGNVKDNAANLDMESVNRNLAKLSENERKIRESGEFFDLSGLALAHLFKRTTHTVDRETLQWNPTNPCVIAIDPHTSKKHHAVLLGVNPENKLFVLEEFAERSTARQFIKSLIEKEWFRKYRIMDVVFDSAGNADMTAAEGFLSFGHVINEVLAQQNLCRARATTFDEKSDEAFLDRIQDALLNEKPEVGPKLKIVNDLEQMVRDIENAQWVADKKNETTRPKLDISNKDMLSCLKYALATNLYYKKTKDKVYYVNKNPYGLAPSNYGKIKKSGTVYMKPRRAV